MLIANETFECNESYGSTINGNMLVYTLLVNVDVTYVSDCLNALR